MSLRLSVIFFVLLTLPALSFAHGVQTIITYDGDVVVTLIYHEGTPLRGASYEFMREGEQSPVSSSKSDDQGRCILVSPPPGNYRLDVWSADGHGASMDFSVDEQGLIEPDFPRESSRNKLIFLGFAVIIVIFVVLRLAAAKTRS